MALSARGEGGEGGGAYVSKQKASETPDNITQN